MEAHLREGVDAFRASAEVRTIGHLPAGGKGGWATQGKARKAPRGDGPALQRAQRREDSRQHRVIPALGGQEVTAGVGGGWGVSVYGQRRDEFPYENQG